MGRTASEAFKLLGIPRDSEPDAIAHAYRRLARTIHPDVSAAADAAERFADLAEAYRIASTSPAVRTARHSGDTVPIRWLATDPTVASPIVAGPVRVTRPTVNSKGRHHG